MVFNFLDIFHKDKEEVQALKEHYQKGGLEMYFEKDV